MMFLSKILGVFLILCTIEAFAQTPTPTPTIPKKKYADSLDFTAAPKRKNNKFPLSDQKNKGKWVFNKSYSDEFNANTLDSSKWWPRAKSWIGREPTMFHSSNIAVADGNLEIALNKHSKETVLPTGFTHTTGFVHSKKPFLYGYIEAEIIPLDATWVTGFWLSNNEKDWWTEIDICENAPGVKGNEHDLNSNVHVFKSPTEHGGVTKHFAIGKKHYLPFEMQKGPHTWGLYWDEKIIQFYFDGIMYRELENTHWHQPLHININSESNKWFGALPNDAGINEKMKVNYVRLWQKKAPEKSN